MRAKVHPGSWKQPQGQQGRREWGRGGRGSSPRPPAGQGCPGHTSPSLVRNSSLTVLPTPLTPGGLGQLRAQELSSKDRAWGALLPQGSATWAQNQLPDSEVGWSPPLLLRLAENPHLRGQRCLGKWGSPWCPAQLALPTEADGGGCSPAPPSHPLGPAQLCRCPVLLQGPPPPQAAHYPRCWFFSAACQ